MGFALLSHHTSVMAVILETVNSCIVDHKQAITTAYRSCICASERNREQLHNKDDVPSCIFKASKCHVREDKVTLSVKVLCGQEGKEEEEGCSVGHVCGASLTENGQKGSQDVSHCHLDQQLQYCSRSPQALNSLDHISHHDHDHHQQQQQQQYSGSHSQASISNSQDHIIRPDNHHQLQHNDFSSGSSDSVNGIVLDTHSSNLAAPETENKLHSSTIITTNSSCEKHLTQESQMSTQCPESSCENKPELVSQNDSHAVSSNEISENCVLKCYCLKNGFFCIKVPYMMDTQFESVSKNLANVENDGKFEVTQIQQALSNKRKRKRKDLQTRNADEDRLLEIHKSIQHEGREKGIFLQHIPPPLDNNLLSRQLSQLDRHDDDLARLLVSEDGYPLSHQGCVAEPLIITNDSSQKYRPSELVHRKVSHTSDRSAVIDVEGGSKYLLPHNSTFLLSNLEDFSDHLYKELTGAKYDLIVMDPPWENKSVKRKKSYYTMDEADLEHLPLPSLMRTGSLVALWVTNNDRLEDFVVNTLFPAWRVTAVARWHWLKVTLTGDLISSMDTGHKKPYEVLLLGRYCSDDQRLQEKWKTMPQSFAMVSIPCSLHSKKPPLQEVLSPYLPAKPRCLELFARNLWPGWTSWGREALKHQNLTFFDETPNFS